MERFNFSFFGISGWGIDLALLWYCMVCLAEKQIILSFLRLHPSTAFQSLFFDCEGHSVLSKGFLPTVVYIMVIWVKFTHSSYFSSLIPKMLMFTLAISCLTTSNLPWFMNLTFQVPIQYCSLQHRTLLPSPITSTLSVVFFFGLASSFFSGYLPTWGVHLSVVQVVQ